MRSSRSRIRQAIALGVAAGLMMLAGCSSSEAEDGNGNTATGNGNGGGGNDSQEERLYVEIIGGEPDLLNPQITTSPNVRRFSHSVFETLVSVADTGEISPMLAEEWELSEDGLTLTLHLVEGVTWHDGEPFTAEDVAFNIEELFPLSTLGRELAEYVASTETPDDHTVIVHLTEPYGPLLENLALQFLLPKHVYEGTDYAQNPANMAPIGTGPFTFDSFTSGEEIVVARNDNWWQGEIEVDRAIYRIVGDTNARAMALLNNEVDTAVLEPSRQAEVAQHPNAAQLTQGDFPAQIFVSFNTRREVLNDPEVRRLLFAAIDREAMSEVALNGHATPATSFVPDLLSWARHPEIDFDTDFRATAEDINSRLDGLGYPVGDDGYRFTLNVRSITNLADVQPIVEMLRSHMDDINVGINLESGVNTVFIESVYKEHDFDLAIHASRGSTLVDPNLGLTHWYKCNPGDLPSRNPSGGCDEELDAAVDAARSTTNRDERREHLHAWQERAAEVMFHAPIVWSDVFLPTINTTRWQGLDDPNHAAGGVNWKAVTWVG